MIVRTQKVAVVTVKNKSITSPGLKNCQSNLSVFYATIINFTKFIFTWVLEISRMTVNENKSKFLLSPADVYSYKPIYRCNGYQESVIKL